MCCDGANQTGPEASPYHNILYILGSSGSGDYCGTSDVDRKFIFKDWLLLYLMFPGATRGV